MNDKPHRRREDLTPWILKYWPILVLAGTLFAAAIHLEDDVHHIRDRMNFHWGTEW